MFGSVVTSHNMFSKFGKWKLWHASWQLLMVALSMMKKHDPPCNVLKPPCRVCCIHITLLPMLPTTNTLGKLKVHLVLQHLTLDGIVTFTCLASHLKCNILQLQPIPQSNPSILSAILPPPIMNFLGASLATSTDVIDDC